MTRDLTGVRCLVWKDVFTVMVVPRLGEIRFGFYGDGLKW